MGDGHMRELDGQVGGRMESNERDTLVEGAITGLERNVVLGKFSPFPKDDPQVRLLAIVERMPEMSFPYNHGLYVYKQ